MEHNQNERLRKAAQEGNISDLYESIKLDQRILDVIDELPFVETPLHVAAAAGQTHFAIEIMGLKPSFGRKLNPDGFSPLDLALQNGHTKTVKRLVKIEPELIRVQSKWRFTPLHYVVESDEIDLLAEFLFACPPSIEDVTIGGETALHIAVKKEKSKALEVLLGWIQRTSSKQVLNMKDGEGNTPLHIAASNAAIQPKVMRQLITHANKNAKNSVGFTALDIGELNKETNKVLRRVGALKGSSIQDDENLAHFFTSPEKIYERFVRNSVYLQMGVSTDMKNVLLVVAVLIVTATYQAALTPPDALSHEEKNSTIIVTTTTANNVTTTTANSTTTIPEGGASNTKVWFMSINSLAISTSVGMMIFLLMETNRFGRLLAFSLFCMMASYMISVMATSAQTYLHLLIIIIPWLVLAIFIALLTQINLFYLSHRFGHVYRMQRKVVERKYSAHQD